MKGRSVSGSWALVAGLLVLGLSIAVRFSTGENAADNSAEVDRGLSPVAIPGARPPRELSMMPSGIAGIESVSGWTRSGSDAQTRWAIAWKSDAITAARVLAWLSRDDRGIEYALTPAPDGRWTIEATIRSGTDLGVAINETETPGATDELARLLARTANGRTAAGADGGAATAGQPPHAASSRRPPGVAGGGPGFVRMDGGQYSWLLRDEALYLEPVR